MRAMTLKHFNVKDKDENKTNEPNNTNKTSLVLKFWQLESISIELHGMMSINKLPNGRDRT